MRNHKWVVALIALAATGLIAAGCGGDDDSTSTATATSTAATSTTATDSSTTESSTTSDSGGATPDDVYNACVDALSGTPAESTAQTACDQARNAFEQCEKQSADANSAEAEQACQDAANQVVDQLKAVTG